MPGRLGSKPAELAEARAALDDGKAWCALGVVTAREDGAHFELTATDVLVEVNLQPHGEPITARLAVAGGPLQGFWYVPPVGAEVAVLLQDGEIDQDPMIVGILSTNQVPSQLAEDTAVLVVPTNLQVIATNGTILQQAKGKVTIQSTGDDVEVDAGSGKQVKLAGGGPAIGRVGDAVRVTIPAGTVVVAASGATLNPDPIEVDGTITAGSTKVQSG